MTVFRHSAVAALTLLGASFASSASAFNTTPSAEGTTVKMASSRRALSQGSAGCQMKVVEYFSPNNLATINSQLGTLKKWINDNVDEKAVRGYLDSGDDQYGVKQAVSDTHINVMKSAAIYNPGTDQGLSYLKTGATAVVATIHAYTGYVEMLKTMLMDMGADAKLEDLKRLDKTVADLNRKAASTEALLVGQKKHCSIILTQG
jgi:hypothetical protein